MDRDDGVLHALVRPGEKGVAAGDASAERKLQVGGTVSRCLSCSSSSDLEPHLSPEPRRRPRSQTSRPERLHRSVEEATEDHHGGELCDQRPALSASDRRPEPSTPSKARPAAACITWWLRSGLARASRPSPTNTAPMKAGISEVRLSESRRW